jgi:hypothetical protein
MSGRGPYGPPLDRVADCICEVFPIGTPLSIHEVARTCGQYHGCDIDQRTVERYVGKDQAELNLRTSKKCGKKVREKCVKDGIEIVQSLDGTLRDRRKPLPPRPSSEETLDDEDVDACLAEPQKLKPWLPFPPFDKEADFRHDKLNILSELSLTDECLSTNSVNPASRRASIVHF